MGSHNKRKHGGVIALKRKLWLCSATPSNWPSIRTLAVQSASLLTTAHSFYSFYIYGLDQRNTKWAPWTLIHAFKTLREKFKEETVRLYLPSEFSLPKTDWSNMCCLCNWEEKFLNTLRDILIHVPRNESNHSGDHRVDKFLVLHFCCVTLQSKGTGCTISNFMQFYFNMWQTESTCCFVLFKL